MAGHCSHQHHEHGSECDHAAESGTTPQDGDLWSLYKNIDTNRVCSLNGRRPETLSQIIRPHERRLDFISPPFESDTDEQLLLFFPFTSPVNIKSIAVMGDGGDANPRTMKVFVNRDAMMDFEAAEATTETQKWDLTPESNRQDVEYATKFTKFQNVSSLWIFFPDNFGAETTKLQYIGFKGTCTKYKREAVQTVYELKPQAADHKTPSINQNPHVL